MQHIINVCKTEFYLNLAAYKFYQKLFMDYEKLEARVSIIEHFLKKLDKETYKKLLSKAMREFENEKKKEEKQMHDKIMSILKRDGKISASMIQKTCKIGYAHACRILDELESTGIIGPASGSKPRKLLSLRNSKLFNKNHKSGS